MTVFRLFDRKEYKQYPPMLIYKTTRVSDTSIDLLHVQKDHLIVVDSARDLGYHKWRTLDPEIDPPFYITVVKARRRIYPAIQCQKCRASSA